MSKFRLLFIFCCFFFNSAIADKVRQINIEGNSRIHLDTIKNYLQISLGDDITAEKQNQAIQNLYATSFFEHISTNFEQGILTVKVKEYPIVAEIEFRGNVKISSSTLKNEILTRFGSSLSNYILNVDVNKIKSLYEKQGSFLTKVESKIEYLKNDRAKVIFAINEGPKVEVRKITFVDNNNFSDSLLKSKIITREKSWLKFWVQNSYSEEKIEHDKMLLQAFYNSQGFADFRVISVNTQLSSNKDHFDIIYVLEEGDKYSLGSIDITNQINEINTNELRKLITVKTGDTYNINDLDNVAQEISTYIENKGYPEVNVSAQTISKDPKKSTINVSFVVEKAFKAYINKINIKGNTKTRDNVIRRELLISEGDLFNREQIEQSKRRLLNLDYFAAEKLKIYPTATNKANKYDLEVEVEEKSTSGISLHTGYNTASGVQAGASYNEKNFLGMGKVLDTGITIGKKYRHYSLGLVEPHFLDRNMSLGVTGFITKSNTNKHKKIALYNAIYQPYNSITYGFKIDLGYDLSENLYHNLYYSHKYDSLTLDTNTNKISKYIQEQAGKTITSALGHNIVYDRTDNRIFPKNGYIASISQEYAGLGGQNKYFKNEVDVKLFKSFHKDQYRVKIAASAGIIKGVGGKKVRIKDRFNLGDASFRGFAFSGIGPRDKTGDEESLGGQKFYVLTTELNFPLGLPKELNITGNLFADYGALWSFDLKTNSVYSKKDVYNSKQPKLSIGCGILWITRIAPIRIDYAVPIIKKKYDEKQNWHLSFTANL